MKEELRESNFLREHLSRPPSMPEGLRALADVVGDHPEVVPKLTNITLDLYPTELEEALAVVETIGGEWVRVQVGATTVLRRRLGERVQIDVNLANRIACDEPPLRPEVAAFPEGEQ